jgi:gliding motility-associated-like protein
VYNRWGNLVKTLDSQSEAWDGQTDSQQKEEVLYYILEVGNGELKKGSLSILR